MKTLADFLKVEEKKTIKTRIDIEYSEVLARVCESEEGRCYDNIFEAVIRQGILNCKVVLGYTMGNCLGLMTRHIWLENEDGVILDPTYVLRSKERQERLYEMIYRPFKKMTPDEYHEVVFECEDKAFTGIFKKHEVNFYKENDKNYKMRKEGFEAMIGLKEFFSINETDFLEFILPLLKEEWEEHGDVDGVLIEMGI